MKTTWVKDVSEVDADAVIAGLQSVALPGVFIVGPSRSGELGDAGIFYQDLTEEIEALKATAAGVATGGQLSGEADPSLDRGPWEGVLDPVFLLVRRTVRYRWGLEETPLKVSLSRKEAEEYGDREYGEETYVPYPNPSPAGNTWSVLILPAQGALAILLKEHAWSKDRVRTVGNVL